jgi:hypothetical protein
MPGIRFRRAQFMKNGGADMLESFAYRVGGFLLLALALVVLQVALSKRRVWWYSLILPALRFLTACAVTASQLAASGVSGRRIELLSSLLFLFFLYNAYTLLLLGLRYLFHEK